MNPNTTHSEMGEGNHSLADFTINRLHEALEIANKSADDQMFQKREAEAEVERLREEKEYWANQWNILRQSSVADVVKFQAEVARLRELCKEIITELEKAHFHNPISAQFLAEKYNIELNQITK